MAQPFRPVYRGFCPELRTFPRKPCMCGVRTELDFLATPHLKRRDVTGYQSFRATVG